MANLFSSIFKKGLSSSRLAVDIGTTSIKMVEMGKGEKGPEVTNYGILESSGYLARANQALQTSNLKIFESDMVQLLKTLVNEMQPGTTQASASLPLFSVFTTIIDFPRMDEKEIQKALVYQARQYVPLPIEQVALDWLMLKQYQDDKGFDHQKILLISVPREQITRYQRMFSAAGLNLGTLEIETLSLSRLLAGDPTPTLMLDIGSRSSNIIFLEGGSLQWNVQTDFASFSLTQALASSLQINPMRAEELKKEKGITGTGPNYELSTIMLPFLDAIMNEVKKAQFLYHEQLPLARPAERMVLSGGGANLLGIEKYLEREFGIPVVKSDAFSKLIYPETIAPFVPELGATMGVAIGLGLKDFSN
ncbi:MAG TPA: type IV pilus assembly protein PilM [Candidatus Paceibacterota bacterium]|nr:type IV pilus assembly protein PilM [Candidatus Paceibacterota bacterium]